MRRQHADEDGDDDKYEPAPAPAALTGVRTTLIGEPSAIAGHIYAGAPLTDVEVRGNRKLAKRLPSFFPMPDKALPAA